MLCFKEGNVWKVGKFWWKERKIRINRFMYTGWENKYMQIGLDKLVKVFLCFIWGMSALFYTFHFSRCNNILPYIRKQTLKALVLKRGENNLIFFQSNSLFLHSLKLRLSCQICIRKYLMWRLESRFFLLTQMY